MVLGQSLKLLQWLNVKTVLRGRKCTCRAKANYFEKCFKLSSEQEFRRSIGFDKNEGQFLSFMLTIR